MIESQLLSNWLRDVAIVDKTSSLFDKSIASKKTLVDFDNDAAIDTLIVKKNEEDEDDVMDVLRPWFKSNVPQEDYYVPTVAQMIETHPEIRKDYLVARRHYRKEIHDS